MDKKIEKVTKSRNIPYIFTREEKELYMSIKKQNKKEESE